MHGVNSPETLLGLSKRALFVAKYQLGGKEVGGASFLKSVLGRYVHQTGNKEDPRYWTIEEVVEKLYPDFVIPEKGMLTEEQRVIFLNEIKRVHGVNSPETLLGLSKRALFVAKYQLGGKEVGGASFLKSVLGRSVSYTGKKENPKYWTVEELVEKLYPDFVIPEKGMLTEEQRVIFINEIKRVHGVNSPEKLLGLSKRALFVAKYQLGGKEVGGASFLKSVLGRSVNAIGSKEDPRYWTIEEVVEKLR